jgi:hypothetical protein
MRSTGPDAGGGHTVSLPLRFERDVRFSWPKARRSRPDLQLVRKTFQVEISLTGPHMETCASRAGGETFENKAEYQV